MATTRRRYPPNRARPVRPTPDAPAKRRALVSIARRLAAARARAKDIEADRDEAIREAHAAGVHPSDISEITGLGRQRVAQIRRGARL